MIILNCNGPMGPIFAHLTKKEMLWVREGRTEEEEESGVRCRCPGAIPSHRSLYPAIHPLDPREWVSEWLEKKTPAKTFFFAVRTSFFARHARNQDREREWVCQPIGPLAPHSAPWLAAPHPTLDQSTPLLLLLFHANKLNPPFCPSRDQQLALCNPVLY